MSTFGGQIEELENILVDNFLSYKTHTCFFLSHCHTDHMIGIDKLFSILNDSNGHIYCSPVSRLILLNKYSFISENIIEELTLPKIIYVPGSNVAPTYRMTVTTIPAGHCPGSVMFLFETVNQTILYTGDFRISKGDISKFKPLHNNSQIKVIDKLYFDSTFLNQKYWHFPSRCKVVSELVRIIEKWITKNSNHKILLITSALIGYEFVFAEIAKKLKCKIHVKDLLHDFYVNVPEVGFFLTKDCSSTKIHSSCTFDQKCLKLDDKKVLKIKLSAQWYKSAKDSTEQPFWKEVSNQNILMCFSTHCSYSELVDFLNYLKPKCIQPCTTAVGSTKKDEESLNFTLELLFVRQLDIVTKDFTQRLVHSWRILECENKAPETKKIAEELLLKKNYSFELKLPQ